MSKPTPAKNVGNQQSANTRTEADKASDKSKQDKSSGNDKSRVKAGSDQGAGGGAKQKQGH